MRSIVEFVLNVALAEIDRIDQTQMNENVEGAVHRRLVEVREALPRPPQNFRRGQMLVRFTEDGDDGLALRSQAVTRLPQVVQQRMFQLLLFLIATSCNNKCSTEFESCQISARGEGSPY